MRWEAPIKIAQKKAKKAGAPIMRIAVLLALAASVPSLVRCEGGTELKAFAATDRIRVNVGGRLFTDYHYGPDLKFPYFFPIIGPRSGVGITTIGQTNYPHHSSLWFACDKLNGGNYWAGDIKMGQITPTSTRLTKGAGDEVAFEQDCVWSREGAPSPVSDHRRVVIRAPSADRREIDFIITLTALESVRIEKTNHSLFCARMAPDMAVHGGGRLRNAEGLESEKGTFGQSSAWMDARGTRAKITEGLAILVHPSVPGFPPPWFTRDYGFLSPTPLFWPETGATEFDKGETVRLAYRVIVHSDDPSPDALQSEFDKWAKVPAL